MPPLSVSVEFEDFVAAAAVVVLYCICCVLSAPDGTSPTTGVS